MKSETAYWAGVRRDLERLKQSERVIEATLALIKYLKQLSPADQRVALETLRREYYPKLRIVR